MKITRRSFLKYCIGSAASLGLSMTTLSKLEQAFAGDDTMPPVIWLEGASCSGCSVALANLIGSCEDKGPKDVANFLIDYVDLAFAHTYMAAAGDLAVSSLRAAQRKGGYVLIIEGGIPTAYDGMACTIFAENGAEVSMKDIVTELAPDAAHVVCVGSCASSGGIPAAGRNPMGITHVSDLTGVPAVNLPGCPAHPDWVVGTLASVLCGDIPELDDKGRPTAFYGKTIHSSCPRKPLFEKQDFATDLGQEGRCMFNMGCNGPETYADCALRGWNNGYNYCIQSNSICIGCVEKDFPKPQMITRKG